MLLSTSQISACRIDAEVARVRMSSAGTVKVVHAKPQTRSLQGQQEWVHEGIKQGW